MLPVRIRIMLLALRRSGARAALAIAAVALAIASMMMMLALSAGAEQRLRAINQQLGKNLLGITAAEVAAIPGRPQGWFVSARLKLKDVTVLREQLRGVNAVVPVREASLRTSFERSSINTTILGVTPEYLTVRNFEIDDGRALDARDGAEKSRAAVIGSYVARKLNGGFSMVGETIWIGRVPFEVVGQLKPKGASSEGLNEDDQILIPIETAMSRVVNTDSLTRLVVQLAAESDVAPARVDARELLRANHRLDSDSRDDFKILELVRVDEIRRRSSEFLQGLAAIFATVTLAIGGAGVLAVTFLNVKERIPEIGLRIAIGARPRDITGLFIAEACLLSVIGGLTGIVTGVLGVVLLRTFLGWTMAIDIRAVALPFAVSILLGIAFSVVPAMQASSVMPVEALRDS